jgi:formylglycine-generating enzyme required for sulfatase activity
MRGGSWNSPALCCRSAYRGSASPSERFASVGLRIARTAL